MLLAKLINNSPKCYLIMCNNQEHKNHLDIFILITKLTWWEIVECWGRLSSFILWTITLNLFLTFLTFLLWQFSDLFSPVNVYGSLKLLRFLKVRFSVSIKISSSNWTSTFLGQTFIPLRQKCKRQDPDLVN